MQYIRSEDLVDFLKTTNPKLYDKYKNYRHGVILEFIDAGYRNGALLFWDAIKEKVLPPFRNTDRPAIPEAFLVGDGCFNPHHWSKTLPYYTVRPSKSLIKEIKTYFTKNPTQEIIDITINHKTYKIIRVMEDEYGYYKKEHWNNFNWNRLLLTSDNVNYDNGLLLYPDTLSEGKLVNEDTLKSYLKGDAIKQNQSRKIDLQAKLLLAEAKLAATKEEVEQIRKQLDMLGGRKRTRKNIR